MPTYIGIGFITDFDFLYNIGNKLKINKYNVLNEKNKIIEFLKKEYNLKNIFILYNSNIYDIAVFSNILQIADPFCSIEKLNNNYDIPENFEEMKEKIAPDKDIKMIAYYTNEKITI